MERDCRKRILVFCLMALLAFAGSLAGKQRFTCRVIVETPVISKKTASVFAGKTLQLKLTGTTQKVK